MILGTINSPPYFILQDASDSAKVPQKAYGKKKNRPYLGVFYVTQDGKYKEENAVWNV